MTTDTLAEFSHSRNFDTGLENPYIKKAVEVTEFLAQDAVARDRLGGRPSAQIALLKESGLLSVSLPKTVGGAGEPISTALRIVREFAKVDGSIAHLYGYHVGHQMRLEWESSAENTEYWWRRSVQERLFWGNTAHAFSPTLSGRIVEGGYILDGFRPFASGSHVADYLVISWDVPEIGRTLLGIIPANREGLIIEDDWDGIGQTQTGSGKVTYRNVFVGDAEVLSSPDHIPGRALGVLFAQDVLMNVFIGSAQGALLAARDYTCTKSKPWINSGVAAHIDDPWIKKTYGSLYAKTLSATLLVDRAAEAFDTLHKRDMNLTPQERAEGAALTAAANTVAGDIALEVTSTIFEVMGARSASTSHGYDRFWRNVRVHTLHNPAEYKNRNVGYWFLTGSFPKPGPYE